MSQSSTAHAQWYNHVFTKFIARSNEYRDLMAWLQNNLSCLPLAHARRVLSVGAGDGTLDLSLAPMLLELHRYTVVEPNLHHLAKFRRKAGPDPRFEYLNMCIQDYREGEHDTALLAHCLYYFDDRRRRLAELARRARSLVIVHQSEVGIHALQQRFGDASTLRHSYCSRDLMVDLDDLGWPTVRYRVDSTIDVRQPDGDLVDFMLERTTTAKERGLVIDYLASTYPSGQMSHPVDIVVVHPPCP